MYTKRRLNGTKIVVTSAYIVVHENRKTIKLLLSFFMYFHKMFGLLAILLCPTWAMDVKKNLL
jgi:hypothetical protein